LEREKDREKIEKKKEKKKRKAKEAGQTNRETGTSPFMICPFSIFIFIFLCFGYYHGCSVSVLHGLLSFSRPGGAAFEVCCAGTVQYRVMLSDGLPRFYLKE